MEFLNDRIPNDERECKRQLKRLRETREQIKEREEKLQRVMKKKEKQNEFVETHKLKNFAFKKATKFENPNPTTYAFSFEYDSIEVVLTFRDQDEDKERSSFFTWIVTSPEQWNEIQRIVKIITNNKDDIIEYF